MWVAHTMGCMEGIFSAVAKACTIVLFYYIRTYLPFITARWMFSAAIILTQVPITSLSDNSQSKIMCIVIVHLADQTVFPWILLIAAKCLFLAVLGKALEAGYGQTEPGLLMGLGPPLEGKHRYELQVLNNSALLVCCFADVYALQKPEIS